MRTPNELAQFEKDKKAIMVLAAKLDGWHHSKTTVAQHSSHQYDRLGRIRRHGNV